MDTVQRGSGGGSTIQFGYSAGGARLWKKTDGQITGLWIGSLHEEKDGKVLCHVYAGDRLVATFEPEGGFACLIENNRYVAAIWRFGDKTLTAFFGDGRAPLSGMGIAILAGLYYGLRAEDRRRKTARARRWPLSYISILRLPSAGFNRPSAILWCEHSILRQVVLMALAGSIAVTSVPTAAYAGTPVYDPVFYYYHPDHLGSSQLMTDRDGDVVQHYGYSPFGRENYRNNTYAFSVSNRYTGQTLDEETGLYYYGARYYDPELARFIQADSIVPDPEFSQAYNRYAYCYNNPLVFSDPTGQNPFVIGLIVSMAISGGTAAATGGNVVKAMVIGAFSYCAGFGVGQFVGGFEVCGWGLSATGCAMVGGAAAGALSATIMGGNPLMGAVMGAASAGAGAVLGEALPGAFVWIGDVYLQQLAATTTAGALIGGVTAEIMGGDFGQGAAYGAASAAAGYVFTASLRAYFQWVKERMTQQVIDEIKERARKVAALWAQMKAEAYGGVENIPKPTHCIRVGYCIYVFGAGFTADGAYAGILNSDFVQGMVNRAVSGYYHIGAINPDCNGDAQPYWVVFGPAEPVEVLVPLPVKFDIYTGPDIMFGNIRFQSDFWHNSRTTIQLRGNAMLIAGLQKNPLE